MHTTQQLLDLAKQRLAVKHGISGDVSDYRLAKLLGLGQATVSSWRIGRSVISTDYLQLISEACELAPEYVYACIEHDREENPHVQKVLQRIAKAFKGKAAATAGSVIVSLGLVGTPRANAENSSLLRTSPAHEMAGSLHIMSSCRCRRSRVRRRWSILSWLTRLRLTASVNRLTELRPA